MSGAAMNMLEGVEVNTWQVSVVVTLIDSVVDRLAYADLAVSIDGQPDARPIRNLSARWCFLDLAPGDYTISIAPRGRDVDRYLPATITVSVSEPPTAPTMADVPLFPAAGYPFEPYATVIEGRIIVLSTGDPVDDAGVRRLDNPEVYTASGRDGRFWLDVRPLISPEMVMLLVSAGGVSLPHSVTVIEGARQAIGDVLVPLA